MSESYFGQTLTIYTDGGCHGNPGPGGWACVIMDDEWQCEFAGFIAETTNNRMELTAVIRALEWVFAHRPNAEVTLTTDSQYVKNGITQWIHSWVRKGWVTSQKKPVKNQDLWQQLYRLSQAVDVDWQWTRGHAGDAGNERCDALVQNAIRTRSNYSG